jgi:hypothetical protein
VDNLGNCIFWVENGNICCFSGACSVGLCVGIAAFVRPAQKLQKQSKAADKHVFAFKNS